MKHSSTLKEVARAQEKYRWRAQIYARIIELSLFFKQHNLPSRRYSFFAPRSRVSSQIMQSWKISNQSPVLRLGYFHVILIDIASIYYVKTHFEITLLLNLSSSK
jgi:hypothetical protein